MQIIKQLLLNLQRWQKNAILILLDSVLVCIALTLAFLLRLGFGSLNRMEDLLPLFGIVIAVSAISFWFLGVYKNLLRAISIKILNTLSIGVGIAGIAIAVYGYLDNSAFIPRSIPAIFAIAALALVGSSRIFGRWLYRLMVGLHKENQPIMIFGAGETGTHVAAVLDNSREFSMIGFIDDDKKLWGSRIRGKKIHPIKVLEKFSASLTDLRVLICIAKITSAEKLNIIERLQAYPVQVLTIPPLPDVIAGRSNFEDIKEVKIEELLGREPVPPIRSLFQEAILDRTVLVTGGGGSIGSEICKQIISNQPAKLVVLESSEIALYQLEQQLIDFLRTNDVSVSIEYILANVIDTAAIERVFSEHKPDLIYHAAAYKHVPIVEQNVTAGLHNNVVGTFNIADAAARHKCERFILVSTDKAVRPTNVMGATKRVAELVVQSFNEKKTKTVFSMVRFGNVLGSSGSVIPKFREQIAAGGPVTVTHADVTRYFMTIPEAAQLVIQAGSIAKGGEVFVLDMGEPVEILKLAKLMVQLSGKTTKDVKNPDGEIEIEFTGLRPGEKLYEELLISDNATGTIHPKIMTAMEDSLSFAQMGKHLAAIEKVVEQQNTDKAIAILEKLVAGFQRK